MLKITVTIFLLVHLLSLVINHVILEIKSAFVIYCHNYPADSHELNCCSKLHLNMLHDTKFKILFWSYLYIPMSWGKVLDEKA
jgi:hypothetical protein